MLANTLIPALESRGRKISEASLVYRVNFRIVRAKRETLFQKTEKKDKLTKRKERKGEMGIRSAKGIDLQQLLKKIQSTTK